jgi:hypothetical protein
MRCTITCLDCSLLPGGRGRRSLPFSFWPWRSGPRTSSCLATWPRMPGPGTSSWSCRPAPRLPLAPEAAQLLNFLTGDAWTLKLREFPPDPGWRGEWRETWQPQEVLLFSGGLDSLAGAIDRLEMGRRILLVSHYDFDYFYAPG